MKKYYKYHMPLDQISEIPQPYSLHLHPVTYNMLLGAQEEFSHLLK